jgi:hypothetical protein
MVPSTQQFQSAAAYDAVPCAAAADSCEFTLLKTVEIWSATLGITAPAATATCILNQILPLHVPQ